MEEKTTIEITLTGAQGTGKSYLAMALATMLREAGAVVCGESDGGPALDPRFWAGRSVRITTTNEAPTDVPERLRPLVAAAMEYASVVEINDSIDEDEDDEADAAEEEAAEEALMDAALEFSRG